MSQELELYSRIADPLDAISKLGEFIAQSAMFGADSKSKGAIIAWACLAERKSPFVIARTYHIIEGKLSKKALAALAEFRGRGGKHKWIQTGDDSPTTDATKAVGEFSFEGNSLTVEFSIARAKAQGLPVKTGSGWVKTPGDMLRARIITRAVAMLCPEIFAGGDVEDESEPSEPRTMELKSVIVTNAPASPTVPATAPPAKAAPIIEVAATVAPQAHLPSPNAPSAPVAAPNPPASPADTNVLAGQTPPPPAPSGPSTPPVSAGAAGRLAAELERQVETIIGPHTEKAFTWLLKEGWIRGAPDGSLFDLTETRARGIIQRGPSFLRAIGAAK